MRLEIILDWLENEQPDVLALQETKVQDKDFPKEQLQEAGWQVEFRGEKSYNGVAFISKEKAEAVSFGLQDDEGESATRFGHLKYAGINIINTYVPQGRSFEHEMFSFKLAWFARLKKYLEDNCKQQEIIWVGDLNVAPFPLDVHDSQKIFPHVCHCSEVSRAFASVCDLGFVDIFRRFLPGSGNYTYWDYRPKNAVERGLGWRIDHILATKKLAEKALACRVDVEPRLREKPSDHTFVIADFSSS